ncbi:MAG: GspMb/PilO family protein [Candidatus Omnitrophota bacterium]|jgi:hypothetical protein
MKIFKIHEVYAYISRLPKRQRYMLYFSLSLAVLAVMDRLIIYPVAYKIDTLNKEIDSKAEAIRRDMRIIAMKDKIVRESSKYSSFFKPAKSEEEENTILLKEIENIAGKSMVYLIDIKPASVRDEGPARKFTINLNCEAQMEQLIDFMYGLENSALLLIIEKLQISQRSAETSVIRCAMSVSRMAMP